MHPNGHICHHTWSRRRDNALELAVHRWTRASDDATILVIGMIHIAEPEFYEAVLGRIARTPNARVLFEGIGRSSVEDLATMSIAESNAILRMRLAAQKRIFLLTSATGLTSQRDVLDPRELDPGEGTWHKNADMTDLQFVRAVGLVDHPKALGPDMSPLLALPGVFRRMIGWFVRALLCRTDVFSWDVTESALDKKVREVVEDQRNAVAIDAALEVVQTAGVVGVLPWGGKHLPGMGDMLVTNGFELIEVDWSPAVYAKRRKR